MESFEDEEARNDRAEEIRDDMKLNGRDAYAFDAQEWREYRAFRLRVKATLPQIEEAWRKYGDAKSGGLLVSEAVALYLAKRKTAGRSKDGIKHRDLALKRFEEFAGDTAVASLTEETITSWFDHLRSEYKLGDVAVAGHFSAIRAMFNLPSVKKVCRENPCDYVEAPSVEESDEVAVLSLRQAFEFFKVNRDKTVAIGRLAAEAFAGLRFSSAAKLRCEDLDFAESGITLPASRHKSNRRHYVDGFPRNLWLWLKFAPVECWSLSERNYMRQKSEAFARTFDNPGNVLRHTMPTMHLSAFKDAAKLATLLQHRNATMLYQRYKGRGVSQAVGRAYFMITPKTTLLTFERFCCLTKVPTQP